MVIIVAYNPLLMMGTYGHLFVQAYNVESCGALTDKILQLENHLLLQILHIWGGVSS
jgi:hypothetical protein